MNNEFIYMIVLQLPIKVLCLPNQTQCQILKDSEAYFGGRTFTTVTKSKPMNGDLYPYKEDNNNYMLISISRMPEPDLSIL